jgi:hypothetical protein
MSHSSGMYKTHIQSFPVSSPGSKDAMGATDSGDDSRSVFDESSSVVVASRFMVEILLL